jgi:nuclear RNA export factor
MLDELLSSTEKKGKANAGMGGLKILVELKLNGCKFREDTLQKSNGDELYQQSASASFIVGTTPS